MAVKGEVTSRDTHTHTHTPGRLQDTKRAKDVLWKGKTDALCISVCGCAEEPDAQPARGESFSPWGCRALRVPGRWRILQGDNLRSQPREAHCCPQLFRLVECAALSRCVEPRDPADTSEECAAKLPGRSSLCMQRACSIRNSHVSPIFAESRLSRNEEPRVSPAVMTRRFVDSSVFVKNGTWRPV